MSTTKRLVLSLRGRKESQSTTGTSSTRLVSTNSFSPGHDLAQVSAVSGSEYSSQILLNGPYDSSNSRPHLTDLSSKFDASRAQLGPSASHQGIFISHESLNVLSATNTANPSISTTTSDIDLAKKCRKISLQSKSSAKPLLISWDRRKRSHGGLAGNAEISKSLNPTSKNAGMERLQFEEKSGTVENSNREHPQNVNKVTFIFDPAGRLCYYWSMIVSLAFLYNFWVIIYRFAFQEININSIIVWFCLDYFADFLYLIDILFHFRTGYLEDGVLQTDSKKLRHHYMNSTTFYIDCLCLLPLDFLYLSVGFNSILRSFRLVKMYRFWAFMDRTERHTNYPNLFRSTSLIHYLLVIFHWNGCLYHIIHKNNGFGSRNWVYHDSETADVVKQYLQSFYWCTLALTTIGDLPKPRSIGEYVFVIMQLLFGLMLFATVLGHVANIVTSVSSARKEFQAKLDDVKTYMRLRRVPNHLQVKVIKWFDYLWLTQKCSNEERAVSCLPDKLKAEIAINVHLDTLKRVEIFQNTEAGFLCELVLKLRPVLFSPGDYICRKGEHYHPHCQRYLICILGEVGKEMYIVNRGRLQVVADNGKTVMASLKAGSYFGEISILNMGTEGNRRTASVRSVGYSDLFVLSKKDMWDVLKEYPAARVRLESIAVRRLEKYKRSPFQSVLLDRCQSTPGLVESLGRTTLEDMWLPSSSPLVGEKQIHSEVVNKRSLCNTADYSKCGTSTCSNSPSVHSSDDHPRSRTASIHSKCISRIIPNDELNAYLNPGDMVLNPPAEVQQVLEDEINRLRARLHSVESENQVLTSKLSQQQWNLETRLAELEMQMQRRSSTSSIDHEIYPEDIERNRESII